jgi:hypothetical protein
MFALSQEIDHAIYHVELEALLKRLIRKSLVDQATNLVHICH